MKHLPRHTLSAAAKHCCLVLIAVSNAACATGQSLSERSVDESIVQVPSRGVQIPATVALPATMTGGVPLVVLAHGHGGSRSAGGGYDRLAQQLAALGIASIRMDFPGCGDNTEPFTSNNLDNMLADIAASRAFAIKHYPVDVERMAIHGYSMGARLALLSSREHRWQAIGAWAPVVADHEAAILPFLGGRDAWERLRAEAETRGAARFVSRFGQPQALGAQWFSNMASSRPLQAAANYTGHVFAICGEQDDIAPVSACNAIARRLPAASVATHMLPGADHSLGLYGVDAIAAAGVIAMTANFFQRALSRSMDPATGH